MRRFGVRTAAAAAEVITFELVNSRIDIFGTSFAYPTGKQAGDLVLVGYGKANNGGTSIPSAYSISGFGTHLSQTQQLAAPSPGTAVRLGIMSRVLDGTEGANWSGSNGSAKVHTLLLRPSKPIVSRTWSGNGATGAGANNGGGNWSGLSRPFVAFGFSFSATSSGGSFRGFDSAANLTILSAVAAYGIYDSEDADIPSSIDPGTAGGSYAMASIFGRLTFTF